MRRLRIFLQVSTKVKFTDKPINSNLTHRELKGGKQHFIQRAKVIFYQKSNSFDKEKNIRHF